MARTHKITGRNSSGRPFETSVSTDDDDTVDDVREAFTDYGMAVDSVTDPDPDAA